jgi:AAA family ATP:ADP antiporter
VIYPYREALHPLESADYLQTILPAGFKGLISMYRYWTFTVFYVISELWSTIIMTVLFWGFANEITRLAEARRFYSVLAIASNFAAIVAGVTSVFVSQDGVFNPNIPLGNDAWEQTMMILVLLIIGSGLLTMAIFRWMNKNVLNDPSYDDLHQIKRETKKKGKLSFKESLSYVSNSKYLICIAVIVVSYNLVINMVEVVWKDQLKNLFPSPSDYNNYINNLTAIQGVVSTLLALMLAKMINRMGWTWTALITPVVMIITCLGFFGILFYQDTLAAFFLSLVGMSPLAIAVFFGSAQNCLSKACKYSVFDSTKEMAYIPLSHESKLKGKAAIDGVGSRLGKSGGSLIHQGLLMVFATVTASAPYVGAILLLVIVFWCIAVKSLGKQFDSIVAEQEEEALKSLS